MESNEILDRLPKHLKDLIIDQPYNSYTAQDHAVWRYVMQQNIQYLPKVAHHSYLEGLKKTGVSIHQIPHMYGMNRILKEIGWAAAAVDGFIPPSAFMEFQAYHVLVIAADIRPIDQLGYTPAPDIIHEAAGHAPIIADPSYAEYLVRFGEIGSKAFRTKADYELYEAIRLLSILKSDPYVTKESIIKAESEISAIEKKITSLSELAMIRNLHWWTVEYGLIGDLRNPKIYGAGLLSSISESYNCLQANVKKLPYSLDAAKTSFDITKEQPQLFVTPDFEYLTQVLEEFANGMALRTGGLSGIKKAIASEATATCELDSGLQVTGTFTKIIEKNGEPVYIQTSGETALCYENAQVNGQGRWFHKEGFGFPVGKVKEFIEPLFEQKPKEIDQIKNDEGYIELNFTSGVRVKGKPKTYTQRRGKIKIITFTDCKVTYQDTLLFDPSWGVYDLATGSEITSCYPGAADPEAFGFSFPTIKTKTHKIQHSDQAMALHRLYQAVRDAREKAPINSNMYAIWQAVKSKYPKEWLIALELTELIDPLEYPELHDEIATHLEKLKAQPAFTKLISDGLSLLRVRTTQTL